MKQLIPLMRADAVSILSRQGGSRRHLVLTVAGLLLFALVGLFVMPDFMAYAVVLLSLVIVPTIIGQETRSGAERMLCVIPIDRRNIVYARFLLACGSFTAVSLLCYILLLLGLVLAQDSITLDLYLSLCGSMQISVPGLMNVLFSTCYVIGLAIICGQLRNYFSHGAAGASFIRRLMRFLLTFAAVIAVLLIFMTLCSIPLARTVIELLMQIIVLLASPLNGLLMMLTLLVIAAGIVIYQIVCSVIDYEAREL